MNSEAAKWFLSTISQVTATLLGLLFIGFVFWFNSLKEKKPYNKKSIIGKRGLLYRLIAYLKKHLEKYVKKYVEGSLFSFIIVFLFVTLIMGIIILIQANRVLLTLPIDEQLSSEVIDSVNYNKTAFEFFIVLFSGLLIGMSYDVYSRAKKNFS